MQPLAHLGRVVFALRTAFAHQHRAGRDPGDSGEADDSAGRSPTCGPASASDGCSCTWSPRPSPPGAVRYGQRAWVRLLEGEIQRHQEDRLMEVIERFDGRPFPTALRIELVAPYALAGEIAVR
jgi:hypothetical protein